MIYECTECHFCTHLLYNFNRHNTTPKHLAKIESQSKNNQKSTFEQPKVNPQIKKKSEHVCKYCHKEFSFKQSMYKHIKYTCPKNKDEDLKELVRLMNLQIEQQKQELKQKDKQIETQSKQMERLMNKLEIHGSFNTTNIQNNIQLLSFKDTDMSHLTDRDYAFCIKHVNFCVKNLIEKIHFNPAKPENMNIYISNLKDKYLMVYENGNWNIKNKKELDFLYEQKEMMLEEWIHEQDKYPELKEKFIQYVHNKDNDETLNMIKDEIKLMMYNKRALLES